MTPKDSSSDNGNLYRHIELKLEKVVEKLLLSKVNEKDDVLSTMQKIIERLFVTSAMSIANNNVTRAAKMLGMSRNTLSRKLRDFEEGL
jgi:DNA-binding protein Fis